MTDDSDAPEQHETLDDVAAQAVAEMDYGTFEGQFGNEQDVSIPCQLRFTEPPEQRTQKFHMALDVHGFSPLDHNPDRTIGGRVGDDETPYYDGEICSSEHYNRLRVLVFRGNKIRLFPHDGHVPDAEEVAGVLHALTVGFRADLEHFPIDDGPAETDDTECETA